MPINSEASFEDWLGRKPQEVAVIVAVRSALRAVPVLKDTFRNNENPHASDLTLATFRALGSCFGAGVSIFPTAFADSGADYASDIVEMAEGDTESSVLACARSAVDAAYVAAANSLRAMPLALSSVNAAQKALFSHDVPAHLKWNEISHDVHSADRLGEIVELAYSPLYAYGPRDFSGAAAISETAIGSAPDEVFFPWYAFKNVLQQRDENWEIWIKWYEDRLLGRPYNHAFAKALLELKDNEWEDNNSSKVNELLQFSMRNHERQERASIGFGASQTSASQVGLTETQILGDPVLGDQPAGRPAPPIGAPTMGRADMVPASDRMVSVRDNQEPFDQLEKSLDQIRDEFAKNHNYIRKHFDDFDRFEEASRQIREQIRKGFVNLNLILDSMLPLMKKLADFCKYAGIIGGALWIASGNGIRALEKIISVVMGN